MNQTRSDQVPAPRPEEIKRPVLYKRSFDYTILVMVLGLVCFGLVMVYSASYYTAELRQSAGSSDFFFFKQLISAGIGAAFMMVLMFFDYHWYVQIGKTKIRLYWIILIAALAVTALVFTPLGKDANGSRRWVRLFGMQVQPSELVKFALIIFMSASIGRNPKRLESFWKGFVPYVLLLGVICAAFIMMPNLSAVICVGALAVILLYIGGAKLWHLGLLVLVAIIGVAILAVSAEYRSSRLDALKDPMGDYQVRQSLISIASGGLFGRGLGNSMQKLMYLPFSENDFIFAIIVEELGLVGGGLLLVAYGVLVWRGVMVAMHAPDLQGTLMAGGVVAILVIQVVINIGVVINLLPPTGVVLPFISYGGSSLMVFMGMMGLLLNVSRQSKRYLPPPKR